MSIDEMDNSVKAKFKKVRVVKPFDNSFISLETECFDIGEDLKPYIELCKSAEGLATSCGMMRAINGNRHRKNGLKAVYVIGVVGKDISKIGISADPLFRIQDIQGSHYEKLYLHSVIYYVKGKSGSIEKGVLEWAEDEGLRLEGEWVRYPQEEVLEMALVVAKSRNFYICDASTWFRNMAASVREMATRNKKYNHIKNVA